MQTHYSINRHLYKLIVSVFLFSAISSQDISGYYSLQSLYSHEVDIVRDAVSLQVQDIYGFNEVLEIEHFDTGEIINQYTFGPYNNDYMSLVGLNVGIDFSSDGIVTVQNGTYWIYPSEGCISTGVMPIAYTQFQFNVDFQEELVTPEIDLLGLDSPTNYNADSIDVGYLSFSESPMFDNVPLAPIDVELPFDINYVVNGISVDIPAGESLPGKMGGFIRRGIQNSIAPGTFTENLTSIEIIAIDGMVSGMGLGSFPDEDEDGDGTLYDRTLGLPGYKTTVFNSECELGTTPIWGDVRGEFSSFPNCEGEIHYDPAGLVYDAEYETWSGFFTYNAMMYFETGGNQYLVDDSANEFDSNCLDDGINSDCSGKLIFQFISTCVPTIQVRHYVMEFYSGCTCTLPGDYNCDGTLNVLDVISIIQLILENETITGCGLENVDLDDNATVNILDIVMLVNLILGS